jgi:hypothetical protein
VVFVQVIQGQVADAGKLKAALDQCIQALAPGSIGWLGTTAGPANIPTRDPTRVTGTQGWVGLARAS